MNYGMRGHDICPPGDIDTVLDTMRTYDIHQIQLAFGKSFTSPDLSYGHYSPGLGQLISEKLKEREIHVAVLGCYINPTNPDEGKRQAEVNKFIEHLKYARAIGADMVGTETGRYSTDFNVVPETYTEECYQLLLKSMREIVAAAEKLGIIVGIEAVFDHTLYSPEMMKRFLDDIDSPNIEAILDPVNLVGTYTDKAVQADIINRAFDLYGEAITMVHVKDFVVTEGQQEFAYVNEGAFDYLPLMKRLKAQKPYITMLLENSNPDRYHRDVEYLQSIYEQA